MEPVHKYKILNLKLYIFKFNVLHVYCIKLNFKIYFFLFNTLYLHISSIKFCNISTYIFFVMHLPEDVDISGRNMWEVASVYSTLPYTYVHLLVLISSVTT
jgi:hypothetical protein